MGTNALPWIGNAALPFQGAGVGKTANQTLTTATNTTVTFTSSATDSWDTGSFWSAGDNAFIAPGAGYMQVFGGARWATVTSSTYRRIRPMKDGAVFAGGGGEGFLAPATNSRCAQSFMSMPVPVVGGEKFTMQALHNRGSNLNIDTNARTYFGCRFIPQMQGVLLNLSANESIADDTLTYVPWDAANFDHLTAWTVGDPTKITIPHWIEDNFWIYAGTHFQSMSASTSIDIDRDTGSRPGGTIQCLSVPSGGAFDAYQTLASGLFVPRYDGSEYGGEFSGFDSIPNDYKLQVKHQLTGAAKNLIADGQTYLGLEVAPGIKTTRLRKAASQTLTTGTDTILDWGNDVDRDDYGMFNSGTPTKLVTPPGYNYARVLANISWENSSAFDRMADIFKAGAAVPFGAGKAHRAATGGETSRSHVCSIIPISSAGGEEFTVNAWQNSGGNLDVLGGASTNTAIFEISLFTT